MKWLLSHKKFSVVLILICGYLIYCAIAVANEHTVARTTTITPEHPAAASIAGLYDAIEQQRQANGVPKLIHNAALDTSAQQKCADMVANNYYGHVNPTTGKQGYTYVFSNIPTATRGDEILNQGDNTSHVYTSDDFMTSWMNSPEHKSAIISPQYTDVGFATCTVSGKQTVVGHLAVIAPVSSPVSSKDVNVGSSTNSAQSISQLEYEACLSYNAKAGGDYSSWMTKESNDTNSQAQVLLDELGEGQLSLDMYNQDMYDLYSFSNTNRDNYYAAYVSGAPGGCQVDGGPPAHWPADEYKK